MISYTLSILSIHYISGPREKVNRKIVKWIPPTRGDCKLNFDGCSSGNPSELGARVCIRDHNGWVLGMLAQKFPIGTNNKAKSMTLLLGLELALQLNIVNIHIEGDSSVVINSCVNKKLENYKFGHILEKAWAMIDKFKVVSFSHTLREGNQVANNLSNIGCNLKTIEANITKFITTNFPILFSLIQQE